MSNFFLEVWNLLAKPQQHQSIISPRFHFFLMFLNLPSPLTCPPPPLLQRVTMEQSAAAGAKLLLMVVVASWVWHWVVTGPHSLALPPLLLPLLTCSPLDSMPPTVRSL